MPPSSDRRFWFLLVLLTLGLTSAVCPAVTVIVQTQASRTALFPGDTVDVTVSAMVLDPASSFDGIISFDLGLLLEDPAVLAVVPGSVQLPGVDPAQGGGPGVLGPTGLGQVIGFFPVNDVDEGVGAFAVLFAAQFQALAPGTSFIRATPDPLGLGLDVALNQSGSPTDPPSVLYETVDFPLPAIAVLPASGAPVIPEPASVLLAGLAIGALRLALTRRRHGLGRQPPCWRR